MYTPVTTAVWPLGVGTPPSLDAYLVLGVVIIAVSLIAVATRRRASDRVPNPRDYAREQISRLREERGVKQDMENLLVQLSELARQINAQIDTRFAKLEKVIADADERISTLEALLRRAANLQKIDLVVDEQADHAGEQQSPPAAQQHLDPRYAKIYELADQGLSPIDIARQTGYTTGEVELILNLRGGNKNG